MIVSQGSGFSLAVSILTAACLWGQGGAVETLSLEQAIRLAIDSNRTLKSSAIATRKFTDQAAALRTKRLPALSFSVFGAERLTAIDFLFDRGALGVYPGVGPIPGKDISVHSGIRPTILVMASAGQPLTQQRKITLNLEMLKLGSALSVEQSREQRQSVVNQVKKL